MPPPPPTYIAIAKEKVMFALNSWRDAAAPASNTATPVTGPKAGATSPAPAAAANAVKGSANTPSAANSTPSNNSKNARTRNNNNNNNNTKSNNNSTNNANAVHHETVDYLVHVEVPPCVPVEAVFFELQTQHTPLQTIEVGYSQTIVPAATVAAGADSITCNNNNNNNNSTNNLSVSSGGGGPANSNNNSSSNAVKNNNNNNNNNNKKIISPFQTPALYAASKNGLDEDEEDGLLLPPPSMALPESVMKPNAAGTIGSPVAPPLPPAATATATATNTNNTNHNNNNNNNNNSNSAAANAAAAAGTASGVVMRPYKDDAYYHIYLIYAEKEEAETVARFVTKRWGPPGGAAAASPNLQPQQTPKAEAAEGGAAGGRGKNQKEKKEGPHHKKEDGKEANSSKSPSPPAAREEEPTAARATVVTRSRLLRNASLVLKGLPNLYRSELIVAEIMKHHSTADTTTAARAAGRPGGATSPSSTFTLSSAATGTAIPITTTNSANAGGAAKAAYFRYKPSYVRLHRGERGAFKNVVFIKYKNREEAEDSKLRLEHLRTGSRLLRVEYKKKVPAAGRAGATAADDAEEAARTEEMLHQLVRDLRTSAEHEGFSYAKGDLSREELKTLKQLCQSYGLSFDLGDTKVVVRRQLGAAHQMHPTPGSAPARVGSPSPSLRPQPTPTWAPKTPAAFASTNYKSIKHWRDVRTQTNDKHSLGIVRPLGPEDVAPFLPGRGRPI